MPRLGKSRCWRLDADVEYQVYCTLGWCHLSQTVLETAVVAGHVRRSESERVDGHRSRTQRDG